MTIFSNFTVHFDYRRGSLVSQKRPCYVHVAKQREEESGCSSSANWCAENQWWRLCMAHTIWGLLLCFPYSMGNEVVDPRIFRTGRSGWSCLIQAWNWRRSFKWWSDSYRCGKLQASLSRQCDVNVQSSLSVCVCRWYVMHYYFMGSQHYWICSIRVWGPWSLCVSSYGGFTVL